MMNFETRVLDQALAVLGQSSTLPLPGSDQQIPSEDSGATQPAEVDREDLIDKEATQKYHTRKAGIPPVSEGQTEDDTPTEVLPAAEKQLVVEVPDMQKLYKTFRNSTDAEKETAREHIDAIHQAVIPQLLGVGYYKAIPPGARDAFDALAAEIASSYFFHAKHDSDPKRGALELPIMDAYEHLRDALATASLDEQSPASGIKKARNGIEKFFKKMRLPSYSRFIHKFEQEVIERPHYLIHSGDSYIHVPYEPFSDIRIDAEIMSNESLSESTPTEVTPASRRGFIDNEINQIANSIDSLARGEGQEALFNDHINHGVIPPQIANGLNVFSIQDMQRILHGQTERKTQKMKSISTTTRPRKSSHSIGETIDTLNNFLNTNRQVSSQTTLESVISEYTRPVSEVNPYKQGPILLALPDANPKTDPYLLVLPVNLSYDAVAELFKKRFSNVTVVRVNDTDAALAINTFYVNALCKRESVEEQKRASFGLSFSEVPFDHLRSAIPVGSETGWTGLFHGYTAQWGDKQPRDPSVLAAGFIAAWEAKENLLSPNGFGKMLREWRKMYPLLTSIRPTGTIAEVVESESTGGATVRVSRLPGSTDRVYLRLNGRVSELLMDAQIKTDLHNTFQRLGMGNRFDARHVSSRLTPHQASELNELLATITTPEDLDLAVINYAMETVRKKLDSPSLSEAARKRLVKRLADYSSERMFTDWYHTGISQERYNNFIASFPENEQEKIRRQYPYSDGPRKGKISYFLGGLSPKERKAVIKTLPRHLRELDEYLRRRYEGTELSSGQDTVFQQVPLGGSIIIAPCTVPSEVVAWAGNEYEDPSVLAKAIEQVARGLTGQESTTVVLAPVTAQDATQ